MEESGAATVLLVDDNVELSDLLARSLQHFGHFTVVRAANGVEGLERALTLRPNCIIADVRMPALDGYQLVHALRGDPASASIPVIMLTALAQDGQRLGGLLSGADRYLVKPVKIQDLITTIHDTIGISQAERDRRMRALAEGYDEREERGLA